MPSFAGRDALPRARTQRLVVPLPIDVTAPDTAALLNKSA